LQGTNADSQHTPNVAQAGLVPRQRPPQGTHTRATETGPNDRHTTRGQAEKLRPQATYRERTRPSRHPECGGITRPRSEHSEPVPSRPNYDTREQSV